MAEAFHVGAMPCGMPRTAPEAQHAAADRAPACSFHRFGKNTPGKARVAEKYDASRKTPLRDSAIRKRPGRRNSAAIPENSPCSLTKRRSRENPPSSPLLQSPAHSLAAPMRRACDANPRATQIPRRFCGKPKSPQACPPGPLERSRAAACPHSPLSRKGCAARLRRARPAASAQRPQARSADARPAPQPRCSSAP